MRSEIRSKTASLSGTSDLTVIAPIRPGLVDALDTVTYKTRARRVLRALHLGRSAGHEVDLARLLSDAVERVGRIHAVRIALLEDQNAILLAATFDGAWESYVRVIWQKVARLLDLVFCNSDSYVCGGTHSYEEWATWLRWRQAETQFLFATPGFSVDDGQYLRMQERLRRRDGSAVAELAVLRSTVPPAEVIADSLVADGTDPTNLGRSLTLSPIDTQAPAFRQGLRSLVGLYRLADLYPPGSEDGEILLRAAQELLPEFTRLLPHADLGIERANERWHLKQALDWLRDGVAASATKPPARELRVPPDVPVLFRPHTVQAGILSSLPPSSHGVMLLLAFATPGALARFLGRCPPTPHGAALPADRIAVNLAFTVEGLRAAGFDEGEIAQLPEEFGQGMDKRASLLGDLRVNHPRRWRLPMRNWDAGVNAIDAAENDPAPRIELSAVHAVLQLRLCDPAAPRDAGRALLMARLRMLVGDLAEVTPLSLQWMHRLRDEKANSPNKTVEHFGFGEGLSDPVFTKNEAGRHFPNHVHVGEALHGYGNSADAPKWPEGMAAPAGTLDAWLHNGSFLVVRKLRQDVGALEAAVAASGVDRDTMLAKMMGRYPARHPKASEPPFPLPDPAKLNDFNYRADPGGSACPLHAHIRRANPRISVVGDLKGPLLAGGRMPRMFRRGMSYGEPYTREERDDALRAASAAGERGLVFMSYGASIAEQFEVVQRWLAGGNASGSYSQPSDPFLGLAEPGRERHFRFEQPAGTLQRVKLDGSDALLDEPRPIVRLEWGLYAFAPSTDALAALAERAAAAAARMPWSAERGRKAIETLRTVEREQGAEAARLAWKAALEDPDAAAEFGAASIWAAVREHPGGVLRTPYGVLVGQREPVEAALIDAPGQLSVAGYLPRMHRSFGAIFLGQDAGSGVYEHESKAALDAIATIGANDAFTTALNRTRDKLRDMVARAMRQAGEDEEARRQLGLPPRQPMRWELSIDVRELVDHLLEGCCEQWFGLSEAGEHLRRGGFSWTWKPGEAPFYPGHFMAPSRWFFQPHPGAEVERIGAAHGQALSQAMTAFLQSQGPTLHQSAVRKVLDSAAAKQDPAYAARTLIGLIMGFVPTVDGVLRRVLAQWGIDGTLWSLRALRGDVHALEAAVESAFGRAMQLRTTPDVLWRTAAVSHHRGPPAPQGVDVAAGERVVIGLASATQQTLQEGRADLTLAFGGDRNANPHSTHACPGYAQAMGLMKGFVMALVSSDQPLRPGLAPLTFALDGAFDLPIDPALAQRRPGAPEPRFAQPVRFWAVGDSWLDDILGSGYPDLVTALRPLGYEVANESLNHTYSGYKLSQIAAPDFLEKLEQDLLDSASGLNGVPPPRVVLLDGGGNDIVQPKDRRRETPLFGMLVAGATAPERAIDEAKLAQFLAAMRGHHERVLEVLTRATQAPILIHAYDHPIPDRRTPPLTSAWLDPVFELKGLRDLRFNAQVMLRLIDGLNGMVADVVQSQRKLGRPVHHLKLTGVLAKQPDFGQPGPGDDRYKAYWGDELHPKVKGYDVLAAHIAAVLAGLGLTPS